MEVTQQNPCSTKRQQAFWIRRLRRTPQGQRSVDRCQSLPIYFYCTASLRWGASVPIVVSTCALKTSRSRRIQCGLPILGSNNITLSENSTFTGAFTSSPPKTISPAFTGVISAGLMNESGRAIVIPIAALDSAVSSLTNFPIFMPSTADAAVIIMRCFSMLLSFSRAQSDLLPAL